MFNATKLIVEMEYQHAAVDQYARTVTPAHPGIRRLLDRRRFARSRSSTRRSPSASATRPSARPSTRSIRRAGCSGTVTRYALEKAFLNPQTFAEEGVAAITLGLSRQQMNEVDEFITPALEPGPARPAARPCRRSTSPAAVTSAFRRSMTSAPASAWPTTRAGTTSATNMFHPEIAGQFHRRLFVSVARARISGDSQAKAQLMLDLADGAASATASDPFGGNVTATDAIAFLRTTTRATH